MVSKGKGVDTGKRKRGGKGYDDDKTGGGGRKRNREVLQFFEDAADMDDEDDESDFSDFGIDDFVEEDFDIEFKVKQEPGKTQNTPIVPKEEEMDEEEFDRMMEERYGNHPAFIRYAEDSQALDRDAILPSKKDPTIWKVKCMVGKERQSVFCIMQKFVDVKALFTKLQIISSFSIDHVKGFIFMEADKQNDINEACKGLSTIYASRVATVPLNEIMHLFSLRSKSSEVTEGMWVRVKNGKYKGDLAQIVAVNNARRKATVKLIPRIDLQMMAQKFGGGVTVKNVVTPAPRLISSSELEEFRPLINYRRDRDTGLMFEVLDGLMFKDGYLYKKVSLDSLSCWGIVPTEEELLKFTPPESNESHNLEWLTQLYGGAKKKKRIIGNDKGNEKGESSSGSGDNFELYDLVCFDRKDFGLIVGMEKDGYYKILKEGPEGPVAVTLERRMLKIGPSDMKFTAFDQHKKTISMNDTVRILEGPLKDRQGIVRQIYRGIVFIYDETEIENVENGGYFTSKAQNCEKVKLALDTVGEKGGDSGAKGFEDFPSSPKSPLSPKKPWEAKENNHNFHQGDGMFSIGQTLRIRVGPLKGYRCRVLAIRRSDVTVKLDSQQKVLTVKSEHLSEVRSRNSTLSACEDPGTSSFKPFDILGNEGGSSAWGDAAGTSTDGGWNAGSLSSNERTSWPSFAASGSTIPTNQPSALDNDQRKENSAWERKVETNQNSSWGIAAADDKGVANSDSDWGRSEGCWNKAAGNVGSSNNSSDGWAKACVDLRDSSKNSGDGWGQATLNVGSSSKNAAGNWGKVEGTSGSQSTSWGNAATDKDQQDPWGKGKDGNEEGSWGKGKGSSTPEDSSNNASAWNQHSSKENASTWGKAAEVQGTAQVNSCGKASGKWDGKDSSGGSKAELWKTSNPISGNQTSGWGSTGTSSVQAEAENADKSTPFGSDRGSWNKQEGKSSWSGQAGSSWIKQDGGGTWKKQDRDEDGGDGWTKPFDGGCGSGHGWGRGGGRGGQGEGNRNSGSSDAGGSWDGGKNTSWGSGSGDAGGNSDSAWGKKSTWKSGFNDGDGKDSGWGKKGNYNPGSNDKNENAESNWGKKNSWSSGSGDAGGNSDSTWGKKSDWNSGSNDAGRKDSGWGQKGKVNPGSSDKNENAEPSWGKQTSWGSGSGDAGGNSDSTWGKKSDWNAGSNDGEGKDSGWGQKGNWNSGSSDKNENAESSWGKKTSCGSGSGDAGGNSDSSWGKKSNWNSGSNDGDGKDSGWGKKGNWNSGSGERNENTECGFGKKTSWSSGHGNADGSQESGWSKKSNWSNGSGDANQDSGWGRKSSFNFGGGNANNEASVDGDDGTGGGNWSGSFRGRGGSDGGSFRGRGERGGFRGRGDRGGCGSRGRSDRGGYGGRFGSDTVGFGRRGGRGDRGGFNGRGGGRGYQSWNDGNDSSQGNSYNWKNEANSSGGVWKGNSSDGGGSWSQGGGDKGNFRSWGSSGSGENNQAGGWSSQSKGWNWGTDSNTEVARNQGNNWKSSDSSGGGQWSSWSNSGKEVAGSSGKGGSWNKEEGSGAQGWGKQGSGWNKGADAADDVTTEDQTKSSWNQSGNSGGTSSGWNKEEGSGAQGWGKQASGLNKGTDAADTVTTGDQTKSSWNKSGNFGGTSSGSNKSEEKKESSCDAGGETSDPWGKASSSSWSNKGNDGSSKGGW